MITLFLVDLLLRTLLWLPSCNYLSVLLKDTVDEDVEQKRKASLPKASVVAADEVHDEENNGYGYEDDEFEVLTRLLLNLIIFFYRVPVYMSTGKRLNTSRI